MNAIEAYLLARAYTNKAIAGAGALKGAPCQIKSITSITGGHRVTFEWEDDQGETTTKTMDVMDGTNGTNGTDGNDGVGISSITYKEEDQYGNYVYTVLLTDSNSYDITCPKGPQGATGQTGQTGATGNGIASIEKTSTVGLVDTYTITYTNGDTDTFTVTNGEDGPTYTAGDYISISGQGEISVNREIPASNYSYEIVTKSTGGNDASVTVKKYNTGTLVSSTDYVYNQTGTAVNIDGYITLQYTYGWRCTLLQDSTTHAAGYVESWSYSDAVDFTEVFPTEDTSGQKLIIKSEMDAELADKADTDIVADDFDSTASYVSGNYCIKDGKLYKFKANHSGAWSAADVDEVKITGELSALKNGIIYAFHIDGSEDDPDSKVTYLKDAIGMRPAKMDYTNGVFDYGSWKDAFFMPRPCMVRQNGTVDYYLKEDDYTKKADGTASDIADTAYAGNAMMEWGRDGKKIWMKIEPDSGDANSCTVYIADHQVDATYHDWSFHNCNGVSVDHFYTPIYNGSAVSDGTNDVLRSLSGQYISHTQNASAEITMAGRNNAGSAEIWGTEVYADIVLINMLLTLIGKSTNTQAVFGRGLDSGSETAMKAYVTGALNDKGLFFGYNDGDHGVKVFGMENWWACQWRRYRGHIMVDGVQKVKLTYGTEDGSTAAGYNLTGDNYISVGAAPTGTSGQYCDKYEFSPNGAFPKDADNTKATASTHYCDGLWFNNSGTRVPYRGGYSGNGSPDGGWYVSLDSDASAAGWHIGAALSCKPLA